MAEQFLIGKLLLQKNSDDGNSIVWGAWLPGDLLLIIDANRLGIVVLHPRTQTTQTLGYLGRDIRWLLQLFALEPIEWSLSEIPSVQL